MTSTETQTINLLNLLHQYNSLHSHAASNLKDTYWNLTKARQKRGFQTGGGGFGGVEYSVDDVREELRSQVVLDESELVNEDTGRFVLHFDGGKVLREKRNNTESAKKKETDGLRQRGAAATDIKSKWTEETNTEEEQLRSADPLTLFGVPPAALKVAQARSRDAIAFYVEVANLAQEILTIINLQQHQSDK